MIYHVYETDDPRWQEGVQCAIAAVDESWEELMEARTLGETSSAYAKMYDAVSDLKSWHMRFDADKGFIIPAEEPV